MGTHTPEPQTQCGTADAAKRLAKVNRQNVRFKQIIAELNRFVDQVAALAPDVAERAAAAVAE